MTQQTLVCRVTDTYLVEEGRVSGGVGEEGFRERREGNMTLMHAGAAGSRGSKVTTAPRGPTGPWGPRGPWEVLAI